jgi:hypothetical protein
MIAIESSRPANAGVIARPVIQVRSISAAVALSRPKLLGRKSDAGQRRRWSPERDVAFRQHRFRNGEYPITKVEICIARHSTAAFSPQCDFTRGTDFTEGERK